MENCNFPHLFFFKIIFLTFVFIMFHHFCFQWCQNFPKNGKLQFSSSVFIFLSFFFHVSSFCFQWCKNFQKNGKLQFSSFFLHFFIGFFPFFCNHFFLTFSLTCFIIFASSGVKNFQKNETLQFSSFFFHFFISFFIFYYFFSFFIIFAGGNCNFPFFGKLLHHWKQKLWKLKKQ